MSIQRRRVLFYSVVVLNFILILVYNVLTPYMSDDLWYDLGTIKPLSELIHMEIEDYLTWSGRDVGHMLLKLSFCFPKMVFNFVNSIVFITFSILIYMNIDERMDYDFILYILVTIFIWLFSVSFDQTILWVSGACNYLWTGTIILGYITIYKICLYKSDEYNEQKKEISGSILVRKIFASVGMFVLGLLAGWGNENTSGGMILLALVLLIDAKKMCKKQDITYKPQVWSIAGLVGAVIGFIIMITAPGNRIRGAERLADEEQRGILTYMGRLIKLNDAVARNFSIQLIILVVLSSYLILKGRRVYELRFVYFYFGICLVTTYVLVFTAIPMDRALFGAGIFLTIACVQTICYIPKNDIYINTIKYSAIILVIAYFSMDYLSCGAKLVRISRELIEREQYVEQEKAKGNLDIVVPQLRKEWNNKYTFIYYNNDVDEESGSYGNKIYKAYYKVNSIIGIPRSEWNDY